METMKQEDRTNPLTCSWLDSSLIPKELRNALKSVKKRSAPGLDQVDFSMIGEVEPNLPVEFLAHLLDVYNENFDKGFFPDS